MGPPEKPPEAPLEKKQQQKAKPRKRKKSQPKAQPEGLPVEGMAGSPEAPGEAPPPASGARKRKRSTSKDPPQGVPVDELENPWKGRLRRRRPATTPSESGRQNSGSPNRGPRQGSRELPARKDNHIDTAEEGYYRSLENGDLTLFLTVRELVENSLDATDSIEEPHIGVVIEEKTCKDMKTDLPSFSKQKKRLGENAKKCFTKTCEVNGVGFRDSEDIRKLIGTFYCFSKPIRQQARGKFGIGVKMPLIYALESTCVKTVIYSTGSRYILTLKRDQTVDVDQFVAPKSDVGMGTTIDLTTLARGTKEYMQMIKKYLELITVVNPKICIDLDFYSMRGGPENPERFTFYGIGSDVIPAEERVLVPVIPEDKLALLDPRSINYDNLKKAMECSKNETLVTFLENNFMDIDAAIASDMIEKMKLKSGLETELTSMMDAQISHLQKILEKHKYTDKIIRSEGLSPAGGYFQPSIDHYMKSEDDVIFSSVSTRTCAFQGHPFVVEAVIAINSKTKKKGLNIYRFANRAPLVLEEDADLITKVVKHAIKWKTYGIKLSEDSVNVFVSIVSTKIPYNSILKEYICNSDVVQKAVKIECIEHHRKNNSAHQDKNNVLIGGGTEVLTPFLPPEFSESQLKAYFTKCAESQGVREVAKGQKRSAGKKKQFNPSKKQTTLDEMKDFRDFRDRALASHQQNNVLMFEDINPTEDGQVTIKFTGSDVWESFQMKKDVELDMISFWGRVLCYDDKNGRTEFDDGFRAFIHPQTLKYLFDGSRNVALRFLHNLEEIAKADHIIIPTHHVLSGGHWMVFCLDIKGEKVHIMDSLLLKNHKFSNDVLTRLESLLTECWKNKKNSIQEEELSKCWKDVPNFSVWTEHYVEVEKQETNDSGIYVMKFMQYWNGRKLNCKIDPGKGNDYRAEYCYYMLHHECNMLKQIVDMMGKSSEEIPEDISHTQASDVALDQMRAVSKIAESSKEIPEDISHTSPSEVELDKMSEKTKDSTTKGILKHVFKERTSSSDDKIRVSQINEGSLKGTSLLKYRNTHTDKEIELNGAELYGSFARGQCIENNVMDFFCAAFLHDDMDIEDSISHPPRVFLDTTIMCLLHENDDEKMLSSLKTYTVEGESATAKLIFLPFKQSSHWWLYCLNVEKARIDVFDAHNKNGTHRDGEQSYISRLVSTLQKISSKIPNFSDLELNSRHIEAEKQICQDSGIFIMKYMECWDGENLNCVIDPDKENEYREIYMNYMFNHSTNNLEVMGKFEEDPQDWVEPEEHEEETDNLTSSDGN